VVITGAPRKRLACQKRARGFESHPLRHPTPKAPDGTPSPAHASWWHAMPMWYVYILSSKNDGKLYVGSTNDLKRRLEEHRQGRSESTRLRRPLELEAYIAVKEETTARHLQEYFKTGSRIATLRKQI
jgi:putative endonuclease